MKVLVNDELVILPPVTVIRYGVTEEEFLRLADEDSNYELFDGELIMHSPASGRHEDTFRFLLSILGMYVDRKSLGIVRGSRFSLHLGTGRLVEPDLLFVASAHLHRLSKRLAEAPADLVIEILSESTRRFDLASKRQAYREVKTPEVWFVDEDNRLVIIDRLSGDGYTEEKVAEGRIVSQAVPGFSVEAAWLWRSALPDALDCLLKILG